MSFAQPASNAHVVDLRAAYADLLSALDVAWGDLEAPDRLAAIQTAFAAYRAACAAVTPVAALFAQVAGVNTGSLALELEVVANMFHEIAFYGLEVGSHEYREAIGAALRVHAAAVNVAG